MRHRTQLPPVLHVYVGTDGQLPVEQAADRLGLLGLPFLFFIDAAQGRASVLYHRYDGHYGLITPAG